MLCKFDCSHHFVSVLREFHDVTKACVTLSGDTFSGFQVQIGVKQGCALASHIQSLSRCSISGALYKHLPG